MLYEVITLQRAALERGERARGAGELAVLGGRTGHGKTAFLVGLLDNAVQDDGEGQTLLRITSYNVCYTKLLRERSWSATIASIRAAACWRRTEIAAWV